MSLSLVSVARKFSSILAYSDIEELSEEIAPEFDELVKDSLRLVILMERSVQDWAKDLDPDSNERAHKIGGHLLLDLEDLEDALNNSQLSDDTSGVLEMVKHNTNLLGSTLELTRGRHGKADPGFETLDLNMFKWLNELMDNTDRMQELVAPTMTQNERNVDEIDPEDIHPDYNDPLYMSEIAYENAELKDDSQVYNKRRLKEDMEKKHLNGPSR